VVTSGAAAKKIALREYTIHLEECDIWSFVGLAESPGGRIDIVPGSQSPRIHTERIPDSYPVRSIMEEGDYGYKLQMGVIFDPEGISMHVVTVGFDWCMKHAPTYLKHRLKMKFSPERLEP